MANYRAEARRAARRHGVDPGVFERQIQQESGFADDVITGRRSSPAGAKGIAQIMPATARGWGVDPLDPIAALNAAAKNMARYVKQYGSYENALRAYNAGPGAIEASKGYAETNNYVKTILGGKTPKPLGKSKPNGSTTTTPKRLDFDPGAATLAALQQLNQREKPTVTAPAMPAFAAKLALPQGYSAPQSTGAPQQREKVDLNAALQTALGEAISNKTTGGQTTTTANKKAKLKPGGNYSGTTKPVNQLAQLAARVAGTSVTSGKRDTVSTASGGVSDHYAGNKTANARDISGSPAQMDKAAVAIAKALGISYRKGQPLVANVNRNGLRFQILYRTDVGGDHFDHIHVGARRL
ncbi:MAG TPA: lytic transglycosylase domain-containing protein [Solirubrobacteraceae bacterium]|nr:lytic transglycosylase domain-containing protein [Solirubrobacteraceae bacterium]